MDRWGTASVVLKMSISEKWSMNNQKKKIYIYSAYVFTATYWNQIPHGLKKISLLTERSKGKEQFSDHKYTLPQLPIFFYQHLHHITLCIFLSELTKWLDTLAESSKLTLVVPLLSELQSWSMPISSAAEIHCFVQQWLKVFHLWVQKDPNKWSLNLFGISPYFLKRQGCPINQWQTTVQLKCHT